MATYPAVQELDAILQSLATLKAPGVNKTKVDAATKLCMDPSNASIEAALVDSLINAFRNSPITHKLGVLYVVDSITRQWVAAGAIHAGGIRKMTDALPYLLNDYLLVAPENQKDKLLKLFDIWASSRTFPSDMLNGFKNRLQNPPPPQPQSQPQHHQSSPHQPQVPNFAQNFGNATTNNQAANLLAALSASAPPPQQQPTATPQQLPPAPSNTANLLAALLAQQQQQTQQQQPVPHPPPAAQPPFNFPQSNGAVSFPPPPPPQSQVVQAPPQMQGQVSFNQFPNPLAALLPQAPPPPPPVPVPQAVPPPADPNAANQLQLLQQLAQNPEALKSLMAAMGIPYPAAPPPPPSQQAPMPAPAPSHNSYQPVPAANQYDGGYAARHRSRSPDRRGRASPPNRRESPVYGSYDPNGTGNNHYGVNDQRGRNRKNGRDYRQRSPLPQPPQQQQQQQVQQQQQQHQDPRKAIGFDPTLRDNKIRVLSRTLFVGGVKTSEAELKAFFRDYGTVQSCIVNHEKRHAFLKLITHEEAGKVRTLVNLLPDKLYRNMFERVNWAVGFGPTDCANYEIGESVIPIDLLTDADRKWMLTAEYGGTGGNEIQQGMVVEEPDIEIGAGPSSKAIHRRGGRQHNNRGGNNGGRRDNQKFNRRNDHHQNHNNSNQQQLQQQQQHQPYEQVIAAPPAVPGFGAPIPGFPFH